MQGRESTWSGTYCDHGNLTGFETTMQALILWGFEECLIIMFRSHITGRVAIARDFVCVMHDGERDGRKGSFMVLKSEGVLETVIRVGRNLNSGEAGSVEIRGDSRQTFGNR